MPRRPQKSQDELRELILHAARQIIEEHGTETLSAREIARAIKYSPGTLYNVFKNIDDIKWHVEVDLLKELADFLANEAHTDSAETLAETIDRFFEFSAQHSNIWPLIADEIVSRKSDQPDEHKKLIESIETTISHAVAHRIADDQASQSHAGVGEMAQRSFNSSRTPGATAPLPHSAVKRDTRGEDAFIVLYALSTLDATRRLPTLTDRSARDIASDYLKRLM